MTRTARPVPSTVLAVLAGVLVALAGVAHYTRAQLLDERAFSSRAAAALEDEAVRTVVADRTVDALVDAGSADVLIVRPLLASAIEALVGTAPFQRLFALAAIDAHRAIVGGRSSVILELDRAGSLILDGLRSISPDVARRLPEDVEPILAELDPDSLELSSARQIAAVARLWWLWSVLAVLAAAGAVAVTVERRRALSRVAAAVAAAGAAVAAGVTIAGAVVSRTAARAADLEDDREQEAVAAVLSALFGDLRSAALLTTVAGLAVSAVAAGIVTPADLRAAGRRAWALAGSQRPVYRALRGLGLTAAGAALVVAPDAMGQALLVGAGGLLVFLGVAELARMLEVREKRRHRVRRVHGPLAAGAAAAATAALSAAIAVVVAKAPDLPRGVGPVAPGCNGTRDLCERRLNDVFWAGTHNAFSAADEPGWLFANQRRPIERQLEDGVRAFLVDVHFGVRDPRSNRVRTALEPGQETRNRVARELSPEALQRADRIAGGVGLGELRGTRRLFLCHTLCELGAELVAEELAVLRRYLERNRGAVVLLLVEPYVPPDVVERAFRDAGLLDQLAELERGRPLPTLGELVAADRRVVVLTERDGGARPWYLPAFAFAQDTPLGARTPAELSCARFRGDRDSPMLLINHWIDTFPPSPSRNEAIGRRAFLQDRVERCTRRRGIGGAIVAVDFYDRSDVVEVVRRLNARPG